MAIPEVMTGLEARGFDSPDEVRPFVDNGEARIVNLAGGTVGRAIMEPGWRWSEHVKPIAGTDSCQAPHLGYVVSGRIKTVMDDGTEAEIGPGEVCSIPPGHDAWVVGDEACVLVDFAGMGSYAKPE